MNFLATVGKIVFYSIGIFGIICGGFVIIVLIGNLIGMTVEILKIPKNN